MKVTRFDPNSDLIIVPARVWNARGRGQSLRLEGYMLRLIQFECLGFQERDYRVYAQDLPSGWDIDGLLGLTFLRLLNYEVRWIEGRIVVERASSAP